MKRTSTLTDPTHLTDPTNSIRPGGGDGPGDGGPGDPPDLHKAERAALQKVTRFNISASPSHIAIGGTTTVTWSVTIPDISVTNFEIIVLLNGQTVAASGSQSFTLHQTTNFSLVAAIADDPSIGRLLHQTTSYIDTSSCVTVPLRTTVLTDPIKDTLDSIFSAGGGQVSFRDGDAKTQITPGNASLDIAVPLSLNVPDWFDADMDIHVVMTIGGSNGFLVAQATTIEANVDWSLLSDILSLGCSTAVSAGMSKLAEVFVNEIVSTQFVPAVKNGLQQIVDFAISSVQANDPSGAKYSMHVMTFSPATGINITVCPT
jgi:hypothetical protein